MAGGGLAESWIPHNFGFLLKAEMWQLVLAKRKESRRSVDEAYLFNRILGISFLLETIRVE